MSIHHYTNIDAVKSIIENQELWLTHARYMNDSDELLHGIHMGFPDWVKLEKEKHLKEKGTLDDFDEDGVTQDYIEAHKWFNIASTGGDQDARDKRNKLLIETDFYGYSDVTMSSDMTTYRQALRDLPSGLDTVEKVKAKEFPTKPE